MGFIGQRIHLKKCAEYLGAISVPSSIFENAPAEKIRSTASDARTRGLFSEEAVSFKRRPSVSTRYGWYFQFLLPRAPDSSTSSRRKVISVTASEAT